MKQKSSIGIAAAITALALASVISCSQEGTTVPGAEFTSVVKAYTGGYVSPGSEIKVQLASVPQGGIRTDGVFRFKPSVKGNAVQTGPDTIVFVPEEGALKPGTAYTCTVDLEKATGVTSKELKSFRFEFMTSENRAVLKKGEVLLSEDGMTAEISGNISLSVPADEEAVRAMLKSSADYDVLSLEKGNDGGYGFRISGIAREDKDKEMTVSLKSGEYRTDSGIRVLIPGKDGPFRVLDVENVTGKSAHVRITFSEPLDGSLDGAFELDGAGRYYTENTGNIVRLYHDAPQEGSLRLTIHSFIKSRGGSRLKEDWVSTLSGGSLEPSVSLDSDGSIIPDIDDARLTFSAKGLRAVDVRIIKIYEDNILAFLQDNNIGGSSDLRRSGRLIYKHRIDLGADPETDLAKSNLFTLDLSGLMKREPGAIYRVKLSFRKEYTLIAGEAGSMHEVDSDTVTEEEGSIWDVPNPYYYDDSYDWSKYNWTERDDPSKDSYYMDGSRFPTVNLIASDIALIAKYSGGDRLWIAAGGILDSKPAAKTDITVYDYQLRTVGKGRTGSDGLAEIELSGRPFVAVARKDKSQSYLKLTEQTSNNLSRFDVGGVNVQKGMKAFIYGERGVWRPGDTMYLTMILHEKGKTIPDSHPAVMELYTPQGQFYSKTMCGAATDGFYTFEIPTSPDAPTGFWNAYFKVGGASFHKPLRIESIRPNRLKVDLDMGTDILESGSKTVASVTSSWLTGPAAAGLRTKVSMSLSKGRHRFKGFEDYEFNDPLARFGSDEFTVYEAVLGSDGKSSGQISIPDAKDAPGMMTADIVCSVIEKGGDASYGTMSMPFSPFKAYVGIKGPDGDELETDKDHVFKVAVVDRNGKRAAGHRLIYRIYKLDWSWWWENSPENIASYVNSSSAEVYASGTLTSGTSDSAITLRTDYPDWGRFLVYVKDTDSGHGSGKVVTVDWPSYRGRSRKSDPAALKMVTLSTDRDSYEIGETVTAYLPAADGRAFVSIENATGVVSGAWVETSPDRETPYRFRVTDEMAPNFYIHVSSVQKYHASNDLPLRRYGIKAVEVTDRSSHLEPVISMAASVEPQKAFEVGVREKSGKAMTYTLAIVDDGLLDITAFKTPDPWGSMYAREALGVSTWDFYDNVADSGKGTLLPMLGIGGDENLQLHGKKDNRFNPVVRFMGPFTLGAGKKAVHKITLPMYVGSVRVMVVAGHDGAFGNAQKTVAVKSPLMVLPSLPAVLSPGEKAVLPVNVFAMEDGIREVTVNASVEGPLKIAGDPSKKLSFGKAGDKMAYFSLETVGEGTAKITVSASGSSHRASDNISIEVRNPNPVTTTVENRLVARGDGETFRWEDSDGLTATLTLSGFPSIDFNAGFEYFRGYAYSCSEQLAAKGLSLIYSMDMLSGGNAEKAKGMIPQILSELYSRQNADGGFAYWPGNVASDPWVTSMAGHFFTAAGQKGFEVDRTVSGRWLGFQKNAVNNYRRSDSGNLSDLDQAYRLYTMALAGSADNASMNRLKENGGLSPQANDVLASAYAVTGKVETAATMASFAKDDMAYVFGPTYNTELRDKALALEAAALCNNIQEALRLAEYIKQAFAEGYASTQERAFASVAMSRLAGRLNTKEIRAKIGDMEVKSASAACTETVSGGEVTVKNMSEGPLYVSLAVSGQAPSGVKVPARADGLAISVRYTADDGSEIDPSSIRQGTDFTAAITVSNKSLYEDLRNVALCQAVPSGWEIRSRLEGVTASQDAYDYLDVRDDRNIWYFTLERGTSKTFRARLRAAYQGEYILPSIVCEPMYDARTGARTASGKASVTE